MTKRGSKSFLVIKRFACDDVPVFLTNNRKEAEKKTKKLVNRMNKGSVFATKAEQNLMRLDIGTDLCSVAIVNFNKSGKPTSINIYFPEPKSDLSRSLISQ